MSLAESDKYPESLFSQEDARELLELVRREERIARFLKE